MYQKLALILQHKTVKKHLLILGLGAFLGMVLYYFFATSESAVEQISSKDMILASLCGVVIAYVIAILTRQLDRLLPWRTKTASRLAAGIITTFTAAYFLFYGLFYGYQRLILGREEFGEIYGPIMTKVAILLLILTLIYTVVYFALYSYYTYANWQIETVRQERKHIDLQLNALKSQLSPHFLFNSLNTISALVHKEPQQADVFIRKLAQIYQYTLDSYENKLTTLQEELHLVKAYQFLLQTRFGKKLTCNVDIPINLMERKIPPLTLQMLLENAIKHNQLAEDQPLHVQIGAEKDYIYIKNNITKSPDKKTSFHIGLKNINARYQLLANKEIIVSKDQFFEVKLPLIS